MSLIRILRNPFTPDMRKEQFEELKEYLQTGLDLECEFPIEYEEFEVLYNMYYFIARPMKEDKEILELLSKYNDFVEQYWESIEMPWKESDEEEDITLDVEKQPLYQLADCIVDGNFFVLHDVEQCLLDYERYYEEKLEDYLKRGIDEEIYKQLCKENPMEICWIGLADSLIKNGHAVEMVYGEPSDNLPDKLVHCRMIKANSALLNKGWFSDAEGLAETCHIINKKWRGQGLCLALMDIHCNSYLFFPCKEKELEKMENLAKDLGYMICHSNQLSI